MNFNTPKIPEKIKVGYTMERVEQYIHCDVTNAKNMLTMSIIVEGMKCVGNVVNKILTTTLMAVNCQVNVVIAAAIIQCTQDLVRFGGKRRKY